ncbi:MAG TPA: hypothetical protein VIN37_07555 [Candidatus Limnocylindria bacterium]
MARPRLLRSAIDYNQRVPVKRRTAAPSSPLSFRMPQELRRRLRRFADERSLGESEALRLIVSEYLDESVTARELELAERWQYKQAYATFKRSIAGKEPSVPWSELDRAFDEALMKRKKRRA